MSKKTGSLVFLISLFAAQVRANEFLVKWKSLGAYQNKKIGHQFAGGAELLEQLGETSQLSKIYIPTESKNLVLEKLRARPSVEYIVPNTKFYALGAKVSLDPKKLQDQWALQKVNAKLAWSMAGTQGSHAVVLAVLDTGVDLQHESLAGNIISGYDFKDDDEDPTDITSILNPGHGTHCAGIAGATGLVENGVSGMSPRVSIMPVRILGKDGGGGMDDAVQGIDYAIARGAHIISASWSGEILPAEAKPLVEAVMRARDAGIVFVTSAGNGDENGVGYNIDYLNIYPAGIQLDNVITVAASDESDFPTVFTNVGRRKVHIAAPGFKILSTLPKNRYDVLSGTSMAAPLVAGMVALLKSVDPHLTPYELRSLLQSTGTEVNMRTACNCRMDAWSALETVYKKKSFLVPDAATLKVGDTLQFSLKNAQASYFQTTDSNIAEIDSNGKLLAKASGNVYVTSKDTSGNSLMTSWIRIKAEGEDEDSDDQGSSSSADPYACPLETAEECEAVCVEHPGAPWCEISQFRQ